MINDCYSLNDNEKNEKNDKNDNLTKYKLIKPKIDISLLNNRLSNIKKYNISNENNANSSNMFKIDRNLIFKNENISLNNISNSNINQLSQNNNKKISINKNFFKKIKKLHLPIQEKYSNAILFNNRKTKHFIFATRNKSSLNMDKNRLGNNISIENDNLNNKKNFFSAKHYNLNNKILTPEKRINSGIFLLDKKLTKNNSYIYNTSTHHNCEKKNTSALIRANSAFLLPKIKSLNLEKNLSFSMKKKEKEKEKIIINQNLKQLLYKIKSKILPKKRIILSSYKLPSIINKNKKNENINSCIHKLEYGNSIVFVKTHLDGLEEEQKRKEKKAKTIRKYEINEGYVDLNILNSGNNISFKTNLISKDGIYYYEFNKYGRMETVEEKVHKIKKDKKEFKHLLERYKKNELFKFKENKDFEIIKKNYGAEPIINKNIYRDLFHMLFRK